VIAKFDMAVGAVSDVTPAAIYGTTITLSIVCIIITFLRFWVRTLRKVRVLADDWFTIPALVSTVPL
jgi:hypothetical protein